MNIKNAFTILSVIVSIGAILCITPFMIYVVFPFFNNFAPEKKLERFIDEKCLEGNEIAIRIRKNKVQYYYDRDFRLIRAAIEGNDNAIKALKLESEKKEEKKYTMKQ